MTENPIGQLVAAVWLFGGIVTWIVSTPLWWRSNANRAEDDERTESYSLAGFEGFMTAVMLPIWVPVAAAVGVFWLIGKATSRLVHNEGDKA